MIAALSLHGFVTSHKSRLSRLKATMMGVAELGASFAPDVDRLCIKLSTYVHDLSHGNSCLPQRMTTTAAVAYGASAPEQEVMPDPHPIATEARDPNFQMRPGKPRRGEPRGGSKLNTCIATILSCGLGGFECDEGGVNMHWRCCRMDYDDLAGEFCCFMCICGCCGCCGCWCGWAELVHRTLNVDYYPSKRRHPPLPLNPGEDIISL